MASLGQNSGMQFHYENSTMMGPSQTEIISLIAQLFYTWSVTGERTDTTAQAMHSADNRNLL